MSRYTITMNTHDHGPLDSTNPDPTALMRALAGTGLRAGKTLSMLDAAMRSGGTPQPPDPRLLGTDRISYPAMGTYEHPAIRAMRTEKR